MQLRSKALNGSAASRITLPSINHTLYMVMTCVLVGLLSGCNSEESNLAVRTPEQMTRGSELYNYYCRHCHKIRGPGELLNNRDPSRPPLEHHQLIVLMQFGDRERHRNMPTFLDVRPAQLDRIADYVVQLQTSADNSR
ncbi:MAG: cytochrome c [Marinobacterium sp.]|nr:cytochrome c [Marinobacterium sp.]